MAKILQNIFSLFYDLNSPKSNLNASCKISGYFFLNARIFTAIICQMQKLRTFQLALDQIRFLDLKTAVFWPFLGNKLDDTKNLISLAIHEVQWHKSCFSSISWILWKKVRNFYFLGKIYTFQKGLRPFIKMSTCVCKTAQTMFFRVTSWH